MKSRILLPAILLAAATSVYAQPSGSVDDDDTSEAEIGGPEATSMLKIHLADVVGVIVTQSPDLAKAKFDRTIAKDQAEAERRNQSWVVSASTSYSQNGIADHVEAPPWSVVEQDTLQGTIGIGRNLPTGGSISIEGGMQHQHTEYNVLDTLQNMTAADAASSGSGAGSGVPNEDAYSINSHFQVTWKQPLVRGLGSVAVANERKADLAAVEATIKAQLQAEDTLKDVITSYWELAYAGWEVDIRLQSLDMAQKQEALTHDQVRAGTASNTSVSQVNAQIYQRQEELLKSEVDVESKSMDLLRKSGFTLEHRQTLLHPAEKMEIGDDEFDIDEVLARAKVANRKLATLQIERKSADVDILVANDLTKPQVDATASIAIIGIGESASDSITGIGNGDGYQGTIGLSVSWDVSGAAKKGLAAAEMKKSRIEIDRIDTERQIETQTVLAVKQVAAARKRVEFSTKAKLASNDNVRSERMQFQAGRTTNYNVLQRQGEAINARLSLARAVADYHIAVATLQYLSGTLLDQYGIDVKPHARR
jgi:outer membrane protein TolC